MEPDDGLAALLADFARTMLTDFPIRDILDELVTRIVGILPVTGAGVTLLAPDFFPEYVAASSPTAARLEALQNKHGEGPCRTAFITGEAVVVPDLRTSRDYPTFAPAAVAAGTMATFSFPLRQGPVRLGALDLSRDAPGPLTPGQLSAAQTLADVVAAYLINAQARYQARQEAEAYRERALHDPLTGLANRSLLFERLEHAAAQAERTNARSAVIFADLDGFKSVNDRYGHDVGDLLLIAVARRLAGVVRPGDTLARVSGDEFVVLCEGVTSPPQVASLVRRIEAAFAQPFEVDGRELKITASLGVAHSSPSVPLSGDLLREADAAMYRAKRGGGGTSQVINLSDAGSDPGRATSLAAPRASRFRSGLAEHDHLSHSAPDLGGDLPALDPGGPTEQPLTRRYPSPGA